MPKTQCCNWFRIRDTRNKSKHDARPKRSTWRETKRNTTSAYPWPVRPPARPCFTSKRERTLVPDYVRGILSQEFSVDDLSLVPVISKKFRVLIVSFQNPAIGKDLTLRRFVWFLGFRVWWFVDHVWGAIPVKWMLESKKHIMYTYIYICSNVVCLVGWAGSRFALSELPTHLL